MRSLAGPASVTRHRGSRRRAATVRWADRHGDSPDVALELEADRRSAARAAATRRAGDAAAATWTSPQELQELRVLAVGGGAARQPLSRPSRNRRNRRAARRSGHSRFRRHFRGLQALQRNTANPPDRCGTLNSKLRLCTGPELARLQATHGPGRLPMAQVRCPLRSKYFCPPVRPARRQVRGVAEFSCVPAFGTSESSIIARVRVQGGCFSDALFQVARSSSDVTGCQETRRLDIPSDRPLCGVTS